MALKKKTLMLGCFAITAILLIPTTAPFAASVKNAKNLTISTTSFTIDQFLLASTTKKIGKLEFIGGLEIESDSEYFGGFSGLSLNTNGQNLIAISDQANWLTAQLKRDENGKLTGIYNSKITCLCRNNGAPYGGKYLGDSESLVVKSNKAYVSFEGANRINTYDLNDQYLPSAARQATPSFKSYKLRSNRGLESLALAPSTSPIAGKFLTIAEDSPNSAGNHRAFIASKTNIEELSISATNDYQVTDAVFLENGDLLILERKIGVILDLGARIRRFKADTIAPAKNLTGEILFESGITSQIDNMEGLAAWKNSKGETILTLISDDNFIAIQRTILIEFKLPN